MPGRLKAPGSWTVRKTSSTWFRRPDAFRNLSPTFSAGHGPPKRIRSSKAASSTASSNSAPPFLDGNGRMGRFLQTAMPGVWNPLFHAAPIENMVYAEQTGCHEAINASTDRADSGPFIDFIPGRILATIREKGVPVETDGAEEKTVEIILQLLRGNPRLTQSGLAAATGLTRRGVEWNLRKLKDAGRLRRVGPDKGGYWEVV